ncbi:hypothetical protein V6N13_051327 [Hibiscus sabdariffa]
MASTRVAAIGVIARDQHGLMIDGCARRVEGNHTAETIEAWAFEEGIRLAHINGWESVIVEGDALGIDNRFNAASLDDSVARTYFSAEWAVARDKDGLCIQHVNREANRAAHELAQACILEPVDFTFVDCIPPFISTKGQGNAWAVQPMTPLPSFLYRVRFLWSGLCIARQVRALAMPSRWGEFVTPTQPTTRGFSHVDARSRWLCATRLDNVTPNTRRPCVATVLWGVSRPSNVHASDLIKSQGAPSFMHRTVEPHSSSMSSPIGRRAQGALFARSVCSLSLDTNDALALLWPLPCLGSALRTMWDGRSEAMLPVKKLVVGPRGGSAGPPHGEHRSPRPYCRRCAPHLNWSSRSSGAVTLKKLECSKQAYACIHLHGITSQDSDPIVLAFRIGVMINRDSRGHSYFIVKGEILGFMKDEQLQKHLPRMFSLIKNES